MDVMYYESCHYGMGTVIKQRVGVFDAKEGEAVCQKASERIEQLERKMSYFIPESLLSQLNASNGESNVELDPDTLCVLKSAGDYYKLSGGAFDITAAPLTALWRDCIHRKSLPSKHAIQSRLSAVFGDGILLDEKNSFARMGKRQSADLGGIGKGYAADAALRVYKDHGVTSAFIDLGGNVHTLGKKANGEPWMIGLQNPRGARGEFIAVLALSDQSVVTSGDYEKYFESGGRRFHHIIDPRTGYPVDSGLMSATVLSRSSMEADALSTAVFVSGLERGMELIKRVPGAEGIAIAKDKTVFITKGLKDCFIARSDLSDYTFVFYD